MSHVGIDLEQFVTDPQGSGIQRVLQQLALHWPTHEVPADFVVPYDHGFLLLSASQAAEVLSVVFTEAGQTDPRGAVATRIAAVAHDAPLVDLGRLMALFDAWLLPEVSYLTSVHERFRLFSAAMPTCMIGFDILPMSEPWNYRFRPGSSASVSEYFRLLATCDSVVCISDFTRDELLHRLRRDSKRAVCVAHPGGDHINKGALGRTRQHHASREVRFLRVGTLEARKQPTEILDAFRQAAKKGMRAELVFVGSASASDESINSAVRSAAQEGIGVQWIEHASDSEILDQIASADLFLSVGTEGFGIPVLEAISMGTPVLFSGRQPAGEVMEGRGATRLRESSRAASAWADAFAFYANPDQAEELRLTVAPDEVPTWGAFAATVAQASRGS